MRDSDPMPSAPGRSPRPTPRGGWLTLLLITLVTTPAAGQEAAMVEPIGEAGAVVFVPAFHGGVTADVGYETRFPDLLSDDTPWATDAISGGLGYLGYVDGHGRWALGGALRGAWAFEPLLPGRIRFTRLDLRLESRWRAQNRVFAHVALSTAVEIGALLPAATPTGETGDPELRWALLIGSGPGVLFNSHPFLFGELIAHLGVEGIHRPGGLALAIVAGVRIRFDYGLRGRDLRPCEYDPVEYGPCL